MDDFAVGESPVRTSLLRVNSRRAYARVRSTRRFTGRTVHHRLVHFPGNDRVAAGCYLPVRIVEALGHSLLGEVLAEDWAYAGAEGVHG